MASAAPGLAVQALASFHGSTAIKIQTETLRGRIYLRAPEILEPRRRQLGAAHGGLDVLLAEVGLQFGQVIPYRSLQWLADRFESQWPPRPPAYFII
jgi:hypothetical protein